YTNLDQISINIWIKLESHTINETQAIISKWTDENESTSRPFHVQMGGNQILFLVNGGCASAEMEVDDLGLNEWNQITFVYDNTNDLIQIYHNGVLKDENSTACQTLYEFSNQMTIGCHAGIYQFFDGNIDEISIWTTALTQEEIQSYMTTSLAGNETGLVGYWNFNEGEGSTLTDLSGNENHGTIVGAIWSEGVPMEYIGSFDWQATTDLPTGFDQEDVSFRLTPADNDPGTPSQVDSIHIDFNDPPSITLTDIYAPQVADMIIEYAISDTNSDMISLLPEYSLDGETWQNATVLGQTQDITDYDSSLTWLSTNDLGLTFNPSVRFRITPYDNDQGTTDEMLPMVVNNYALPYAISATLDEGEQSDTVTVHYTIVEPQLEDISLLCQYSLDDGATWQKPTLFGDYQNMVLDNDTLSGDINWLSYADLPEIELDSVLFRIFPIDQNGTGLGIVSNPFTIDNNTVPTIAISPIVEEVSDTVKIYYSLDDIAGDSLSFESYFSIDDGFEWEPAVLIEQTNNIDSANYSGSIHWISTENETEGLDIHELMFMIIPSDNDTGGADTILFHLDNNRLPSLTISDLDSELSGVIEVSWNVSDPEDDGLNYSVSYSMNLGDTWDPATWFFGSRSRTLDSSIGISEVDNNTIPLQSISHDQILQKSDIALGAFSANETSNKSREQNVSIIWDSDNDLPDIENSNVVLRVVPIDADSGIAGITDAFELDNWQSQTVLLAPILSEQNDTVFISHSLADNTDDTLNLFLSFSIDEGLSWIVFDSIMGITNHNYNSVYQWSSRNDLENQDIGELWVEASPKDQWGFGSRDTIIFHLDNNYIPEVVIDPIPGENSGDITLSFDLIDPEDDAISYHYYYYDGDNWTETFDINVTMGTVIWNSRENLDHVDLDDVRFIISPSDNDLGISDTTNSFNLDNYHAQSVILEDLPGEQSGMIPINFIIQDTTLDSLSLNLKYRLSGDPGWIYFDQITGLVPSGYDGNYNWDSGLNLDGVDDTIQVSTIPTDGWQAGASDTIIFHLDNNELPTIIIDDVIEEQHGDVLMTFSLEDAEDDTVQAYSFEYRFSDGGWQDASQTLGSAMRSAFLYRTTLGALSESQKLLSSDGSVDNSHVLYVFGPMQSREQLELTWHTLSDIPNYDEPNVEFRITAWDNDASNPDTSNFFHVDNYQGHSVELTSIDAEQTGDVTIEYALVDTSGDALGVVFEYSMDDSVTWWPLSLTGDTSGIGSEDYSGSIVWDSELDLSGLDVYNLILRAIPYDQWG
ncbi:MAG: LamG domain-containing protein, partial [Candidatus Marinimicrobia bacterium]|nr:LamG domain-containing protein [Candidatus Neomarinimicrobiota bacterium]